MTTLGGLRLRAADADDIPVLSAFLQDAVVPVKDMTYLHDEKRFVMVANRFRWEDAAGDHVEGRIYERVHCGVCFDHVTAVRRRGRDRTRANQILALLSMETGENYIDLLCAAEVAIRLEVAWLLCHLDDIDEPWPTQWRPAHRLDD